MHAAVHLQTSLGNLGPREQPVACPSPVGTGPAWQPWFPLCLAWLLPADGNKGNGAAEQNSFLAGPEERVHALEEVFVPSSDLRNLGPG